MRHGSNSRRTRRGGGNRRPNPRTQTFDSNGPDVRIRGTAFQITEKYMTLAKDAAAAGDAVLAESYLQHAEHYQRIINAMTDQIQKTEQQAEGKEQKQKQAKAKSEKSTKDDVVAESEEADGLRAILKADELPAAETAEKPKKVVRRKKTAEAEKVADPV